MRDLGAEALLELLQRVKKPVFFWEGEFDDGVLRLWSGGYPINWNGEDWLGAAGFGGISNILETTRFVANGVTFTFSGIPSNMISAALGQVTQGRPVKLYFAMLDDLNQVIGDPTLVFGGRMDIPELEAGGQTATIKLSVENWLISMQTARVRRWTAEDQKLRDPTDKGFDYMNGLIEKEFVWG